jgi:hypothetical protein
MGNFYQAVSSNKAVSGLLLDIYTNSSVVLDLTALGNHCGSNDGFVSKWYSQGTSSNTAFQTDPTKMPKIYDGTTQAVLTEGGKPVIRKQSSSNCTMSITNTVIINTAHFFVLSGIDNANSPKTLWLPSVNNNRYVTFLSNGGNARVGTDLYVNGTANSAVHKNSFYHAIRPFSSYNSIQDLSNAPLTTNVLGGGSMHDMQELIIFDGDMSSSREDIENRINLHYSIY